MHESTSNKDNAQGDREAKEEDEDKIFHVHDESISSTNNNKDDGADLDAASNKDNSVLKMFSVNWYCCLQSIVQIKIYRNECKNIKIK